jgi:hypothetical protein
MDCFFIGRLSGAKGAVWQYTANDVASAYCWAELHLTPRNPSARWTSELARRVVAAAGELELLVRRRSPCRVAAGRWESLARASGQRPRNLWVCEPRSPLARRPLRCGRSVERRGWP